MTTVATFTSTLRHLRHLKLLGLKDDELILIKWAAEALADRARREQQARDARAVDEACNLRTGEAA